MKSAGFSTTSPKPYTVTIPYDTGAAQPGDAVEVRVSMPYQSIGIPPARVGQDHVTGVAVMRKEE